ncbi:MAG: hypothetical protein B0W54_09145 [Cellvibrio sp. 79]|nr:MAG: hypothetical protein B0W54_09145 [Cellvibrio sp. 79]
MITYLNTKEKDALLHYAKILENQKIENILKNDGIKSTEDARELASFFWKMVDQTVLDSNKNLVIAGYTNLESLCEDLMQTLRSHFIATGHSVIWEEESDKA